MPLGLPQSSALVQLNQLTGASVLSSFPLDEAQHSVQHSARLPHLQAIAEDGDAEPDLEAASGGLASAGGPQASVQLSVIPAELPMVAAVKLEGSALAPPRSILRRPSAVPTEGEAEEFVPARRQALEVDEPWGCWQLCPAPRPALWDQPAGLPPKDPADQSFPPTPVALFHSSQV